MASGKNRQQNLVLGIEYERVCIWVAKAMSIDGWESDYFNHMSLCTFFGATGLQRSTQWIHDQMGEANPFTSRKKSTTIFIRQNDST